MDGFAVLMLSCDKYAHLWGGYFTLFKKYFLTRDVPIYLGSNTIQFHQIGVKTILSGPDRDWSTSLKRILEQIPERKILILLDDFFLTRPVDDLKFTEVVHFCIERDANHIKLFPNPAPDSQIGNFGVYERGAPYRSSVLGFWDRKYLYELLLPGENPWNFEILGSYRTSYSDGFYCLNKPIFHFLNMIEKGFWFPEAVRWAESEGLDIGVSQKPMLRGKKNIVSKIQIVIFGLVLKIPWRWRLRFMNLLRKLLISY